jgi:hypothetical protein
MKSCLVTAAIATDFEDPDEAASPEVRQAAEEPQLGVLTLAGIMEQRGSPPRVLNLNQAYYEYLDKGYTGGVAEFAPWVSRRMARYSTHLFGFSTICSSYPLTLRIAEYLKRAVPDSIIVLGGPQASVVDTETLVAFPAVDFILRGEADESFPRLVEEIEGARRFPEVPGLTWRSPFGIQRNPPARLIEDLDPIPLPAYHITGELKGMQYASLELGRGCPFSCTFCSTNDFFRRRFRLKSPAQVLADMRAIAARYGIRTFKLVHDMFTVDRKRVVEFCEKMIGSGENFHWACSARTDCVDRELLELMARAGCHGVFFGVETGSKRMQQVIDKGLDVDQAREVIDTAHRLGMTNTVSLITGFPEENEDDLRQTVDMYMHAARYPASKPQLNLLAPLAGTPIHAKHEHEMVLEDLCSDMSHQGRIHNDADRDLIRRYPGIFPNFYLLPSPGLDRAMLVELREFLLMASVRLRWLIVALHRDTSGILDVFLAWRKHRMTLHSELIGGALRHYYIQKQFKHEFVEFIRAQGYDSLAIQALLDYQEALVAAEQSARPKPRRDAPLRAENVHVFRLPWDIQAVIDCLKSPVGQVANLRRVANPPGLSYRTAPTDTGDIALIRIPSLLARALELCDGTRTAAACIDALAPCFGANGQSREAAFYLLKKMRSEKLIEWSVPGRLTAARAGRVS